MAPAFTKGSVSRSSFLHSAMTEEMYGRGSRLLDRTPFTTSCMDFWKNDAIAGSMKRLRVRVFWLLRAPTPEEATLQIKMFVDDVVFSPDSYIRRYMFLVLLSPLVARKQQKGGRSSLLTPFSLHFSHRVLLLAGRLRGRCDRHCMCTTFTKEATISQIEFAQVEASRSSLCRSNCRLQGYLLHTSVWQNAARRD